MALELNMAARDTFLALGSRGGRFRKAQAFGSSDPGSSLHVRLRPAMEFVPARRVRKRSAVPDYRIIKKYYTAEMGKRQLQTVTRCYKGSPDMAIDRKENMLAWARRRRTPHRPKRRVKGC